MTEIRGPRKNRLEVFSSSEDEDEDKFDYAATGKNRFPVSRDLNPLAERLNNISLQQVHDDSSIVEVGRRQRNKAKPSAVINIESDDEQSFEDAHSTINKENLDVSGPKSPEVVAVAEYPRRVVPPPQPKAKANYCQVEQKEPMRIQFLDLPPPMRRTAGFAPMPEVYNDVDHTISKLAKTIEDMPTVESFTDTDKQPKALKVKLHRYQRYGLNWLRWRETHFPGGGILGGNRFTRYLISQIALLSAQIMYFAFLLLSMQMRWAWGKLS